MSAIKDIWKDTAHKLPKIVLSKPNSRQTVDKKALKAKKTFRKEGPLY